MRVDVYIMSIGIGFDIVVVSGFIDNVGVNVLYLVCCVFGSCCYCQSILVVLVFVGLFEIVQIVVVVCVIGKVDGNIVGVFVYNYVVIQVVVQAGRAWVGDLEFRSRKGDCSVRQQCFQNCIVVLSNYYRGYCDLIVYGICIYGDRVVGYVIVDDCINCVCIFCVEYFEFEFIVVMVNNGNFVFQCCCIYQVFVGISDRCCFIFYQDQFVVQWCIGFWKGFFEICLYKSVICSVVGGVCYCQLGIGIEVGQCFVLKVYLYVWVVVIGRCCKVGVVGFVVVQGFCMYIVFVFIKFGVICCLEIVGCFVKFIVVLDIVYDVVLIKQVGNQWVDLSEGLVGG